MLSFPYHICFCVDTAGKHVPAVFLSSFLGYHFWNHRSNSSHFQPGELVDLSFSHCSHGALHDPRCTLFFRHMNLFKRSGFLLPIDSHWVCDVMVGFLPLVGGVISLGIYTVLFLKLYSYQETNKWCREIRQAKAKRLTRSYSCKSSI